VATALAGRDDKVGRAPGTMRAVRAGGRVLARPSTSLAPRILILGGGFAGVTAALELAKRCAGLLPVHITLVSNQNFFLFTPVLAEAATGAVETRHILHPIRPLCGRWGIEFGEMEVEAIDLDRRRATVRHHRSARFGLRLSLPEYLRRIYRSFPLDLESFNGDASWTLPMPARFVIDRGGIVRAAESDPDYTTRPEPAETLEALRALSG
jgi:hypothetical protein